MKSWTKSLELKSATTVVVVSGILSEDFEKVYFQLENIGFIVFMQEQN
jgi:hypothetical protein